MPKRPMDQYKKRTRGRPSNHELPHYIPDTPQNVAAAILRIPPKPDGEWDYQKTHKGKQS